MGPFGADKSALKAIPKSSTSERSSLAVGWRVLSQSGRHMWYGWRLWRCCPAVAATLRAVALQAFLESPNIITSYHSTLKEHTDRPEVTLSRAHERNSLHISSPWPAVKAERTQRRRRGRPARQKPPRRSRLRRIGR